jgi:DNA-binding CsgD family transcriptional regulator
MVAVIGMALADGVPLMCREAELGRIVERLEEPEPAAFVLAGPAGVGKSRLAAEAAKVAAGLGFETARVVASQATASIPFGPFAPFLPQPGQSAGSVLGLLRQASGAIADRAGPDGRLLLVVDDAQHLDDASATLVHQLVQVGTCSVLASVRTPGPVPELVTALWKDGMAERIELGTWGEAQTGEVAATVLGGPVTRGLVRRLWELSRGNALYLRELLTGAVSSGALAQDRGIWAPRRPLTAPERLAELIGSRLASLPAATTAVAELLAVAEPLGLALLGKITDPDGLEDAEAQGLVEVRSDGRRVEAGLAHPLYGEVLRHSMPRSRQLRLLATVAVAIEAVGARRREDLLRLGRWQLESGGPGDPDLLTRAARRAQEVYDLDLSARLGQAALDAGGGAEAGLILGEAKFRSGRHAEAKAVLANAVALCRTDRDRAGIANARAYLLHRKLGDAAAADAVLDEALAVVTEDAARLLLLARRGFMRVAEGDPEPALAAAAPLLDSGDDLLIAQGTRISSQALALLGRGDEAAAIARRGLELHRRAAGVTVPPEAQLFGGIMGLLAAGRFAEAEADAAAAYQATLAGGSQDGQATFLFMGGLALMERGNLAGAAAVFLDAASLCREIDDLATLRWCQAGIAMAMAMSGDHDRAAAAAAERDAASIGAVAEFETDLIERSRAWVAASAGELSRAREILVAAAARAEAAHLRVAEARLLHDLARLGQPREVTPRLALLAELTQGAYVKALAAHAAVLTGGAAGTAAGAAAGAAAEIDAAARTLDALDASLLAAEAYRAAADAYRSEGLSRPASAATLRATELAAACGQARTPGLAAGQAAERLTRREREVAGLAAAGASSRQIAARLVVSVRTVDNHLQSAYIKLGVTGRAELAGALSL